METNGKLSIFPTSPNKPVTAGMMNLDVQDGGLPSTIISDGDICSDALKTSGRNMSWLGGKLAEQGLAPEDIFLMTVDSLGTTIIIPKEKDLHRRREGK